MPTKTVKRTKKTESHKSPAAIAARAKLDERIEKALSSTEGISKIALAKKLGVDTTRVKAGLDRLVKASRAKTDGVTMKTVYLKV